MKYGSLFRSTVSSASFLSLSRRSALAALSDITPPPPNLLPTLFWKSMVPLFPCLVLPFQNQLPALIEPLILSREKKDTYAARALAQDTLGILPPEFWFVSLPLG